MSKTKDKLKTATKKQKAIQCSQQPKRTNCRKTLSDDDGITKSKQLAHKIKTNPRIGIPRIRRIDNNEERICGNGKPMPSLADLEKMFNDSDNEEELNVNDTLNMNTPIVDPNHCSTPKKKPITEDQLKSPRTIKTIADKMLDFISSLPDATVLLDEVPPPPVIKQKKRKKSGIPYIVGNKDRPRVPTKKTTNFCKGDEDYGININDIQSEDDSPKPRAKRSKTAKYSKSIFNAKSEEIAASLKEYDGVHSDDSSDSNKTVAYEYYSPSNMSRPLSFSPLPSTSKDSETIYKNDIRFNESLVVNQSTSEVIDNDLQIIDQPPDTILIDEYTETRKPNSILTSELIVINDDTPPHTPLVNDEPTNHFIKDEDSCIEIIENSSSQNVEPPIPVEDYYSSLDLSLNISTNNDDMEVIDVDEVIAENKAIIEKYCKPKDLDSITIIEPQTNNIETVQTENNECVVVESVISIEEQESLQTQNNESTKPVISTGEQESSPRLNMSPVEFISSTSVQHIPNTLSTDKTNNEDVIENAVYNRNSNTGTRSNSNLLLDDQNLLSIDQSSTCNTNGHPQNAICLISFLKSMSDIAKNYIGGTPRRRSRNNVYTANTRPNNTQLDTENNSSGISKRLGDCPICLDSLANIPVASTICGHIFCMKCISAAVKSSGRRCPTCRKPLKGKGYHQLFL
ncbi:unnamed protein product [Diatraea saccharalis]|uniref:RING-type domain-containing protein n=1 Tax=Diatraea saccharalis TaxID=40085 RepID=A0A9N9QTX4_9NEOP|nr:unnamed protein product [Diatraea saccharalis]